MPNYIKIHFWRQNHIIIMLLHHVRIHQIIIFEIDTNLNKNKSVFVWDGKKKYTCQNDLKYHIWATSHMIHRNSNRRIIMRIPSTYDYQIFFLIIDYAFSTHFWTGDILEHIYLYWTLHIPHVYNKTMYEFGVMYAFKTLFSSL